MEKQLLQGARLFDEQTLAEIYDQYSPRLYRYAMRLLGDAQLAEDCVADTFTRFLQALRVRKGPQSHLQAYLYRIAHNWITDQYRRQPPPPLLLDEEMDVGESGLPALVVDEQIQQEQMRAALYRLTEDQRQVVMLRFLEGWDIAEVAVALDKPEGAVKSLQHRALAALRKLLQSKEIES